MSIARPKFSVSVQIQELTNIPQVSGEVFVKWYLKDSAKPDARGKTNRAAIRDHRAQWHYSGETSVRIGINKSGELRHSWAVFEVTWDNGSSGGRMQLGRVDLNLAEYASPEGQESNRYLLKNSKVNAILNVAIALKQIKGPTDYRVPPLSAPQIFGDITGVMDEHKTRTAGAARGAASAAASVATAHGTGAASAASAAARRRVSKMYHKTYAVSWDPSPHDLTPDDCIEDIFAGGDGLGTIQEPEHSSSDNDDDEPHLLCEEDEREDFQSWVIKPQPL
ncbi:hypothetical protein TRVA0_004S03752 [Trichomonascus vanleenenianus]|uniref:uncharacterized protein n=1 Tax=Trichomonascus vanleenenianus TaxID=2268995 RepID=UPI003EC98AC5